MTEFFGDESVIVPDLPEPILAYRAWTWDERAERLTGFGVPWPTDAPIIGEHRADSGGMWSFRYGGDYPCVECPSRNGEHHTGYGCGIYGFDSLDQLAGHGQAGPQDVWGQVELGGTVYEHAHGYRASHGQIKALYGLPSAPAVRSAAEVYGVPILDLPLTQADIDRQRTAATAAQTSGWIASTFGTQLTNSFLSWTPSQFVVPTPPTPKSRLGIDLASSIFDEVAWTPDKPAEDNPTKAPTVKDSEAFRAIRDQITPPDPPKNRKGRRLGRG